MTHAHRAAAPQPRRAVTVHTDRATAEKAAAARRTDTVDATVVPEGAGFVVATSPKPPAKPARRPAPPPAAAPATPAKPARAGAKSTEE